jgi:hypothetical protein
MNELYDAILLLNNDNAVRRLHAKLHEICANTNKYSARGLIPWEGFVVSQETKRGVGLTQAKIEYVVSLYFNTEIQRYAAIHSRRK